MVSKISVFQIDAFTREPFCGNPAGVTSGDGLTTEQMQNIAMEMNLSETAFLSDSQVADFRLRWFTPTCEVKLCGHATIAALHYLFENDKLNNGVTVTFETLSGVLKCGLIDGNYFMQIPVFENEFYQGCKEEILNVLKIKRNDVDYSIPFILCSNGYLYIYLNDLKTLSKIQPDFNELKKLCNSGSGYNAITLFTKETFKKENDAHLRFFAPAFGINEDPVTGSANGPLLLVMKKLGFISDNEHIIIKNFEQGDIIGRPGRVQVKYNCVENELFISGNAVTVMKGVMFF